MDDGMTEIEAKMLEFRLAYQGLLLASDEDDTKSKHKHDIRRYLHKQLVKLWETKEPLNSFRGSVFTMEEGGIRVTETGAERIAGTHSYNGKSFLPIVRKEWSLVCALDILILRRDYFPIINSGDLDNRVKTLLDALRVPKPNEFSEGDEKPLCCLLEDDKFISELKVTADLLLAPPEQIVDSPHINTFGEATVKVNHALVLIHAQVKPTRVNYGNLGFV